MKAQVKGPSSAARDWGVAFAVVGATCLSAAVAQAQSPPPRVCEQVVHQQAVFRLPFTLSPADRQRGAGRSLSTLAVAMNRWPQETTSPAQTASSTSPPKTRIRLRDRRLDKNGLGCPQI